MRGKTDPLGLMVGPGRAASVQPARNRRAAGSALLLCRDPLGLGAPDRRNLRDHAVETRPERAETRMGHNQRLVHVERAVDLDLDRVLAPRGAAIGLRYISACEGCVASHPQT